MNNTSNKDIFYFGLLQWDILKTLTVVVNFAVVSAGLPLLYFMIWYEHNSGDLMYRTLINQLLSYLCIIEIVGLPSNPNNLFSNLLLLTASNGLL